jgi:DNA processing protein
MATQTEQVWGERMARVALSMIAEPNDPTTGYVLARHGGIETLRLIESDDDVPGLARADLLMWRERLAARVTPTLREHVRDAERRGFGILIPSDKEWPAGLNDLDDRAPYVLWTRGAASFLTSAVSDRATITGARAATAYGEQIAGELATGLADEERTVVSGGAYGIEGAAHKGVLAAAGHTIAVLPSGLDRLYPAGHADLLNRIGDAGLLVTELPPGATPTKHRFEARNRLMAALSGATVIPEAGVRSGSRITVHYARDLGRNVGAVPGPVTSAASAGPNELIKQGLASLIAHADDVIALLDVDDRPRRAVMRPEVGREFDHSPRTPGTSGRSL